MLETATLEEPNKGLYSSFPTKTFNAKFLIIIIDITLLEVGG